MSGGAHCNCPSTDPRENFLVRNHIKDAHHRGRAEAGPLYLDIELSDLLANKAAPSLNSEASCSSAATMSTKRGSTSPVKDTPSLMLWYLEYRKWKRK
jgi:hypothetical protein